MKYTIEDERHPIYKNPTGKRRWVCNVHRCGVSGPFRRKSRGETEGDWAQHNADAHGSPSRRA